VWKIFVGGRLCGRKRCVREINVSCAGDPVHAGDKTLMRETPVQRGRVNRYARIILECMIDTEKYSKIVLLSHFISSK
jgi:hypothetical protein